MIGKGGFSCLTFDWNYEAGYVDKAMSGYVPNALNRLQHTHQKYHLNTLHTTTQILNISHQEHGNIKWQLKNQQPFLNKTQPSCNI